MVINSALVCSIIGALAAYLAYQRFAIFNDWLRPLVARKENKRFEIILSAALIALSSIVGLSLPLTVFSGIVLIHAILLLTDLVGISLPAPSKKISSFFCGFIVIVLGAFLGYVAHEFTSQIQGLIQEYQKSVFINALKEMSEKFYYVILILPIVMIAKRYGLFVGLLALIIPLLLFVCPVPGFIIAEIKANFGEQVNVQQWIPMLSLVVGFLLYWILLVQENKFIDAYDHKKFQYVGNNKVIAFLSQKITNFRRVARIRRIKAGQLPGYKDMGQSYGIQKNEPLNFSFVLNSILFCVLGGVISIAINQEFIAPDPFYIVLISSGNYLLTAFYLILRAIAFFVLIAGTVVASKIFPTTGLTLVYLPGLLLKLTFFTPLMQILLSFILGAVIIALETGFTVGVFNKIKSNPNVLRLFQNFGSDMQDSLVDAISVTFITGSLIIAPQIVPGNERFGIAAVTGFYTIALTCYNISNSRWRLIQKMTVGPAAIFFTILFAKLLGVI